MPASPPAPPFAPVESQSRSRVSPRSFRRAAVAPTAIAVLVLAAIGWASERTPVTRFADAAPGGTPERKNSSGGQAEPGHSEAVARGPLPSGGYVFAGGSMVADARGRSLEIVLTKGCASGARTPALPVDDGTFAFTGQVGKVKVAISGTFVDERRARIRLETTGPNCAGARSVEAELS